MEFHMWKRKIGLFFLQGRVILLFQVRMQANSSLRSNETMIQAFYDIFRQEGLSGLWRVSAVAALWNHFLLTFVHSKLF